MAKVLYHESKKKKIRTRNTKKLQKHGFRRSCFNMGQPLRKFDHPCVVGKILGQTRDVDLDGL